MVLDMNIEGMVNEYNLNQKNWRNEIKKNKVEYLAKSRLEGEDVRFFFNIYIENSGSVFEAVFVRKSLNKVRFLCNLRDEMLVEDVCDEETIRLLNKIFNDFIKENINWNWKDSSEYVM